jgi:CMP/dCMP kinase
MIVAIDGPAGSGKTTTAKAIAAHFEWIYIDTGAMYRAVALHILHEGISPTDNSAICAAVEGIDILLEIDAGQQKTLLFGKDVEAAIRTPEMSKAASDISAIACVRDAMVMLQRKIAASTPNSVMEGRDIGTVVFPDAKCKIFLKADVATRARRRQLQLLDQGIHKDFEVLMHEIEERDRNDSSREHSPLRKAEDAIEVDTTNTSIPEQVIMIVSLVKERMSFLNAERKE